jgi:hypothetical protein
MTTWQAMSAMKGQDCMAAGTLSCRPASCITAAAMSVSIFW